MKYGGIYDDMWYGRDAAKIPCTGIYPLGHCVVCSTGLHVTMGGMGVMTARMPYAGMRFVYAALLHLMGNAALYVQASK